MRVTLAGLQLVGADVARGNERRIEGKIAIVTGGAKGLGEADARLFAAHGAKVFLTDVDEANGLRGNATYLSFRS